MKPDFFRTGEVLLYFLNILLIFLLIFESFIVLPIWLQPFGRMHPLILHFPIAFLVLVLVLDYLRYHPAIAAQEFYRVLLRYLFLLAVVFTSLSALSGLFLSLEDGYTSEALFRHKWSAIALLFATLVVYFIRTKNWYTKKIAGLSGIMVVLLLMVASHLGATLTHGENFLLEPLTRHKNTAISPEEAMVFEHAILTVFEKKCLSCHNPGKSKGNLVLNSKEMVMKGGSSGALFIPGDPDNSLLMHRIHLPVDDDEHMPPKGKTQLTDEEKALIERWIAHNAPFEQRIVQLPEENDLRQLAGAYLGQSKNTAARYDFPPADIKIIESLQHENRVIQALYKNSPALDVVFFNASAFKASDVEDLLALKQQIVSLNLQKMPVEDNLAAVLKQFENLEKLNLNFTGISENGLGLLGSFTKLSQISLSGNNVSYKGIKNFIKEQPSLRSLALWETMVTEDEILKLKEEFNGLQIAGKNPDREEDVLQLNPPVIGNPSKIFRDSLNLQLRHPIRDVEIRFTLDGSDPDKANGILFSEGSTILTRGQLIKARAYKEGWQPSDIAQLRVFKSTFIPDTVILLSRLNRVHPANGALTFFDGEMGTFNANSPAWANNWAGFLRNDMELLIEYHSPVLISSIALNVLVEPETIIFPPASIEIWGGPSVGSLQLIGQLKPKQPMQEGKPYIELIECKIKAFEGTHFKIIARPVSALPEWHSRKGASALLLVDEMFVN